MKPLPNLGHPPENLTPHQRKRWLQKVIAALGRIGDILLSHRAKHEAEMRRRLR
jgi:truncated hemoglobin YjbI